MIDLSISKISDQLLSKELTMACEKVAPLWSLENVVAVNPFIGFADQKFVDTAEYLSELANIQMALPSSFYLEKYREGNISKSDLEWVLSKEASEFKADEFLNGLDISEDVKSKRSILSLADMATKITGKDWRSFMTSRISFWASAYFDKGQAAWKASDFESGIFESWKAEAGIDLTPEIQGLKGFRSSIKALPDQPEEAAREAIETLEITEEFLPVYLHKLLLQTAGWSAYIAQIDWNLELQGEGKTKLKEFLTILLCWEACLMKAIDTDELNDAWENYTENFKSSQSGHRKSLSANLILQEAFNRTVQREIIEKFKGEKNPVNASETTRKLAQAIFCIDVRSETFRRNLEKVDTAIETMGFAGFFAFPINYMPLAHEHGQAQCPALLAPGYTVEEGLSNADQNAKAQEKRQLNYQVRKLWKSLKSGAVTCFSFVSPLGITFLVKLLTDTFRLTRAVHDPAKVGYSGKDFKNRTVNIDHAHHSHREVGIPLEKQVEMAANALRAMSLTENFAKFVLLIGHGSSSVNNPHASGLDCGACGGHSGEANAKVAAKVLNNPEVRKALKELQIDIPDETMFLAGLHDTTTDEVEFEELSQLNPDQIKELVQIKNSFTLAGRLTRKERAGRMALKGEVDKVIKDRSKDWSQVRPEWGLAGCYSFVIAPRERTRNIDFQGRSFLHSYDWKKDESFKVLELIMTAPMIVTSWISLQYFASTVDNKNMGAGNKTLHNVTGGVGVLEGFSGDLRVGLPQQSVFSGDQVLHEPVKLNVIIEAPLEAINQVLENHKNVRDLIDNEWIHLLALGETGEVSYRYIGDLQWEKI
ncbi:YbcC family protein [Jiulongibacter sediminis]|uniref:Probable inorganic carbon transporter subunit DabA n=1 Tax=Jiulongibacter sediminis TaxID=1605367 RepID=A0A0P7BTD0_9BACT|nr:DUF2309 domain-containing protein [Jiulongibacter sediminis]KPM47816.1 hypothetical protein AFM12_11215 [Jiulongibacter sediminis]TBX24000.1 hypothetical protein TK44_11220 [Jiulongibacter sediminis]